MNSTFAIVALVLWISISGSVVTWIPKAFSDENAFLAGFVNHEFLSFMGVIVTITLASAANLFVELTKLEERHNKELFPSTKTDVRHSAYALIGALVAAVVVVIAKPWLSVLGDRGEAAANCAAIGVMAFAILLMVDLVQSAFGLDPKGIGKGDAR